MRLYGNTSPGAKCGAGFFPALMCFFSTRRAKRAGRIIAAGFLISATIYNICYFWAVLHEYDKLLCGRQMRRPLFFRLIGLIISTKPASASQRASLFFATIYTNCYFCFAHTR